MRQKLAAVVSVLALTLTSASSALGAAPTVNEAPSAPSSIPGLPTWPGAPNLSSLPALPGFPLPPAQGGSSTPVPGFPGFTLPSLPGLPGVPGLSGVPSLEVLQAELAKCPPIEVSPGVRIPVPCNGTLPSGGTSPRRYFPRALLPPTVDLAQRGLAVPVKSQEQVGICWAFAASSAAETSLRRQGFRDVISPMHIVAAYSEKRLYGTSAARGTSIAPEAAFPFDPVRACLLNDSLGYRDVWCESAYHVESGSWRRYPNMVAEVSRADGAGRYPLRKEYLSKDPDEIATVLAEGRAVVLGIRVDSYAWGHAGAKSGTLPEYGNADRGGHEVFLNAYTWVGPIRYFRIQNSWGTGWGREGQVWISEASLRAHIMHAAIVEVSPT